MKTKHTPGKWQTSKHGTPDYAPQFGIYAEGDPRDLAIVTGENSEANSQLMAASPEMIYALELAQVELNKMGCECDCEALPTRCAVCAVNSAISKATGQ